MHEDIVSTILFSLHLFLRFRLNIALEVLMKSRVLKHYLSDIVQPCLEGVMMYASSNDIRMGAKAQCDQSQSERRS